MNGQKMWITNGGFADIFIVFAKIDDTHGTHDMHTHDAAVHTHLSMVVRM